MRRATWIVATAVSLAGPVAWAQRAAPQDEPGWTVVEVPGGYYRYETQPEDPAGGGGVTIEPRAPATHLSEVPAASTSEPSQASVSGRPVVLRAVPACTPERRALSARLVYLRGVWFVDDATAEFVLAAQESPLLPQAYGAISSYSPGGANGNLLFTAVSSDLVARTLADDYTRCLAGR